jgi:hypothetical protein
MRVVRTRVLCDGHGADQIHRDRRCDLSGPGDVPIGRAGNKGPVDSKGLGRGLMQAGKFIFGLQTMFRKAPKQNAKFEL